MANAAGLVLSCVQQLCVAFAGTKPLSMAAVALGSMGNITFPAISSIKSKSVQRHEQVWLLLLLLILCQRLRGCLCFAQLPRRTGIQNDSEDINGCHPAALHVSAFLSRSRLL
jgi:hypothetical protein